MVTIFCPATDSAGVRQERVALPRTKTVQAPHWPSPQPYLVPVRPSRLRRTESKGSSDAHSVLCSAPFTIRVMDGMLDAVNSNFPPDYSNSGALPGTSKGTFDFRTQCIRKGSPNSPTPKIVPVHSEENPVSDLAFCTNAQEAAGRLRSFHNPKNKFLKGCKSLRLPSGQGSQYSNSIAPIFSSIQLGPASDALSCVQSIANYRCRSQPCDEGHISLIGHYLSSVCG